MENKIQNLKELSLEELEKVLLSYGEQKYRAKQIYEWVWKKHVNSFDEMTNIPNQTRELCKDKFSITSIEIGNTQISKDKTAKFAFKLFDNETVEGVLIPSKDRTTACVSTQVGCPLGCKFCASGKIKFKRNLTSIEIVDQVIFINRYSIEKFNRKLSNIVIMGMGEPLLNIDNTLQAIKLITSENTLGFSPQRITLSTSGLTNEIRKLADMKVKFNVAISLHSTSNNIRNQLMPVNKSNPLSELISTLKYFHAMTNSRVTFEYLMLNGVNDRLVDAKELADFCKNFPCKINIIEYNEIDNSLYKKSTEENISQFVQFLESKNLIVNVRKSRGRDIDAACGQLANKTG